MVRYLTVLATSLIASTASASETGHYSAGVMSIRDLPMPDPGLYALVYNYFYWSDQLNDADGDAIDSVEAGRQPPTTTIDIDVDLALYALSPTLVWVSNWKLAGAKLGAFIAPSFANSSVGASLSTASGRGGEASASTFNVGDMFVQPVWLGWGLKHWDLTLGYGFCAPTGAYDTETVPLPVIGARRVEASDNVGLGFWTQQLQGSTTWYPWEDRRLAVVGALTYEFHSDKFDFDLKPGQNLSLNWGASQYLPLVKDQSLLGELGIAGYDTWQTTDDTGSDAAGPGRDQVHGIGGQLGLIYAPWGALLNFRGFYEYAARDRFQGASFGLNLAVKML